MIPGRDYPERMLICMLVYLVAVLAFCMYVAT